MPVSGLGVTGGKLNLNEAIAPRVPQGSPRPFAPGEWVDLPNNGGWASEMSVTIPHPQAPGKYTTVPSLWLIDGKPVRVDEDRASQYAVQSGLQWPTWNTANEADAVSSEREKNWQAMRPQDAGQVAPLYIQQDLSGQ